MSSQFAARSLRLDQLFADPVRMVSAPFQRSYAWTALEAGRLLDDVLAAMESEIEDGESSDYFLGTMLFIDTDSAALRRDGWPLTGPTRTLEIVDGQQRLTTLTILLCVLRDLDAEEGIAPRPKLAAAIHADDLPRLALRGRDETFFDQHVRDDGACRMMPENDVLSPAESRILAVREHFLQALLDLDIEQRHQLAAFLLERCSVVLVASVGIDRAYRMFMVLNDSGKPLARNDILKAELLGGLSATDTANVSAAWDVMEARLGAEFESLFSHIRSMYGRPGRDIIAGVRTIAAECGGSRAFITDVMAPAADILDDLRHARHTGSPHSPAIERTLGYLAWLPAADWVPSAMLWWLGKGKDPAELAWFLKALERLAFGLRIMGLGSGRRTHRFVGVIAAIRGGADLKAPGSPLQLLRDELRNIDYNLKDLHARSAPLCKLLLLRLNDEMAGAPQNLSAADLTVEHVLPRKHGAASAWRRAFPDAQEREACTEALGNLVLVSKAQNDKAGNLEFARKHAVYFPSGDAKALALNEYVQRQGEWTPAQVHERDADLMRRLHALWGFGGGESRRSTSAEQGQPRRGFRAAL